MKNKTCGECKHFDTKGSMCLLIDCNHEFAPDKKSCLDFKPLHPTNGDVIQQMSNEELATKFGYPCPPLPNKHCKGIDNIECTECWLAWLNAPAESEEWEDK